MTRFILIILFISISSCSEPAQTLNVMSYNIRLDTESDGINQWQNRKEGIISLIKEDDPDILGIQEGLPNQIDYLSEQLEEYLMIGEGRDGGESGEYSAIYYKNNTFNLTIEETFWLSETPKIPSIGWDAALNRIATVGILSLVNSDKKIVIYNTHFDHVGKIARVNSVNVILDHINENDLIKDPLIVMGDLNSAPDESPIKLLSKNLDDSFNSTIIKEPYGTFNGFELDSDLNNRIDYIFTKNIRVIDYKHINKRLSNQLWPSDHLPIFISLKL